ncbi:hypothetical protein INT47_006544 [Mucor saturninus]|uniref:Uncharacterized protein n=1 Tax=Mucor saturninus TaxID=64648 RepID=A0A8H7QZY9_9FUNG|nr:hypothetical protein INT47_006544 [Mucor saturninus]
MKESNRRAVPDKSLLKSYLQKLNVIYRSHTTPDTVKSVIRYLSENTKQTKQNDCETVDFNITGNNCVNVATNNSVQFVENTYSLTTNSSPPVPSLSPSEFRRLVYIYGSKALSRTFYIVDAFAVENLIQVFNPTTLGEQLDVMSAKLAMSIDLSNIMQVNALKLSLSRIIDTVNNGVTSIFRQYSNNQFWERLNDVNMNINEGMSATAKQFYQEILTKGTINDKIYKKEIRIAIAEEKLSMLKSDQTECLQILDILDIINKPCLTDRSIRFDDDASELTCYRKFAKVLHEILDNTMLDILDGERVSKASKTVAKNLEKTYNSDIPLYNGFGRRIDLILATKDIELSTSEWKKKKTTADKCLRQQAKNIRINKAILRYFLDLPICETDKSKVMTVGMDWTGNMGYMFAVKPLDDIFVTRTLYTLTIPTYIDELLSGADRRTGQTEEYLLTGQSNKR